MGGFFKTTLRFPCVVVDYKWFNRQDRANPGFCVGVEGGVDALERRGGGRFCQNLQRTHPMKSRKYWFVGGGGGAEEIVVNFPADLPVQDEMVEIFIISFLVVKLQS